MDILSVRLLTYFLTESSKHATYSENFFIRNIAIVIESVLSLSSFPHFHLSDNSINHFFAIIPSRLRLPRSSHLIVSFNIRHRSEKRDQG